MIRPADLTAGGTDDPVIEPAWGRADFDAATRELLIGILAIATPAIDSRDWRVRWQYPPDAAALTAAFAPLARWFQLDGEGPRFLQDFELLDGKPNPIEELFIDAPGAQGRALNTDLFEKRDRIRVLSRPAAAMALFTLQAFSPAGGRGNRTGLRGGGPLSTLVVPGPSEGGRRTPLWHQLWANVPKGTPAGDNELPRILPWAVPTRVSETGRITTPEDVDDRQQFFSMPRRIRLVFEANVEKRLCNITGLVDSVVVTGFIMRPYGTQYEAFRHPLTPHYMAKSRPEPVHAPAGRIGYRQWLGCVHQTADGKRLPADCVANFFNGRASDIDARARRGARLVCAGYAMDKMKPLAFVEAEMPLHALADGRSNEYLASFASGLVGAANIVVDLTGKAIKSALFGNAKVKYDSTILASVREEVWDDTEAAFHLCLTIAADRLEQKKDASFDLLRAGWAETLRNVSLAAFDRYAPLADMGVIEPARIVEARRGLVFALLGYGKNGTAFYQHLGLTTPEPTKTKRAPRKSRAAEAHA